MAEANKSWDVHNVALDKSYFVLLGHTFTDVSSK